MAAAANARAKVTPSQEPVLLKPVITREMYGANRLPIMVNPSQNPNALAKIMPMN